MDAPASPVSARRGYIEIGDSQVERERGEDRMQRGRDVDKAGLFLFFSSRLSLSLPLCSIALHELITPQSLSPSPSISSSPPPRQLENAPDNLVKLETLTEDTIVGPRRVSRPPPSSFLPRQRPFGPFRPVCRAAPLRWPCAQLWRQARPAAGEGATLTKPFPGPAMRMRVRRAQSRVLHAEWGRGERVCVCVWVWVGGCVRAAANEQGRERGEEKRVEE